MPSERNPFGKSMPSSYNPNFNLPNSARDAGVKNPMNNNISMANIPKNNNIKDHVVYNNPIR